MAKNILPFTAGSPPANSADDALRETVERARKRVLGCMAIVNGLANLPASDDFVEEGLRETAHILDDIASDLYLALELGEQSGGTS